MRCAGPALCRRQLVSTHVQRRALARTADDAWLFAGRCEFAGALAREQLEIPLPGNVPQIAFAGRSNVGKSSLINSLVGRNNLARVSNTPGRTQQINFFLLRNALALADLPGYGFAKAPVRERDLWALLIDSYLVNAQNIQAVMVLIDSRRGVMSADEEFFAKLQTNNTPYHIVLTKCDKVSDIAAVAEKVADYGSPNVHEPLIAATSSRKRVGIRELQGVLATVSGLDIRRLRK